MKVEPSEENLPQVKQADVDVATWEGINADREVHWVGWHTSGQAFRLTPEKVVRSSCNASTFSPKLWAPSTCQTKIRTVQMSA
jgi:hypothetical protein